MRIKTVIIYIIITMLAFFITGCGNEELIITNSVEETYESDDGLAEDLNEKTDTDSSVLKDDIQYTAEPENESVCVYVCGAVVNEGVYYLDASARKEEALFAAGGYAEGAVSGYINLAEKVTDGERIYFPFENEITESDMISENISSDKEIISENSKVNINTAGKEELMTLPGIGESKAQLIIDYRNENNGFDSIEELMNIDGIKEGIFNKIKDYITVV